jgi:dinuclear metal center YbgI/SA1388 family protein
VTTVASVRVADVVAGLDRRYPPDTAESWDRVGLVVGDPQAAVRRALLVVDCVPETVDEALSVGADLIVAHHPLLLRGVNSVATTTYKGAVVHRLISHGVALFVAHTNADGAVPGVSDALAERLELVEVAPLPAPVSAAAHTPVRRGRLPRPLPLAELVAFVAHRLPATAAGVRAAGAPDRVVETIAVSGGAGDEFLGDATAAGVDAYLCADLRHHPASEHLAGGGPALIEAAHWATERPWLDTLATQLRADHPIETIVSDVVTDVWTLHAPNKELSS